MPKRRALWMIALSMLSAVLLAGCVFSLAPVRPLPRVAYASVEQVALAVGADGVKHYAWTECFDDGEGGDFTCVLVYTRMATGAVLYSFGFVTPIGNVYRHPDVAVSSTGDAYVVYSYCPDNLNCVDYWSLFPADPENVLITSELLHTSAVISEGPPVIAARGDDVYAAYLYESGGYTRLRYKQLSGGSRSGIIDNSTLSPYEPSLGIDSAGNLHAVWVRSPVTDTAIAYSNNTGGVSHFNPVTTYDTYDTDDRDFSQPDLALDDNDRVYLGYAFDTNSDDVIRVRCLAADPDENCWRDAASLTVPDVSGDWNVYRNTHLELIGDQPNLVFAATHNTLTHNEVWWFHPPSTGDTAPEQVTNTPSDSEGEPLIVEENSEVGDVPVIAWRTFHINALAFDAQSPSGNLGFCSESVFVTIPLGGIEQVFDDRGTCGNSGFDLAAHGEWVAGVWVDEESDTISSHAAWTAFNAHVTYMPVTSR